MSEVRGLDAHAGMLVVDGCSWTFDGWTEKFAQSGVTALNLTLAGPDTDFSQTLHNIGAALRIIQGDPAHFCVARTSEDVTRAKRTGKVAIVFNFQNGRPLGDILDRLYIFHELGARSIQLTYNERNYIGDGCLEPGNAGLSAFGRRLVKEMNRLGVLIDLSHLGERTSLEAIAVSDKPCVFSHSNPRVRANNLRNVTDEQIKACAAAGGVIGLCGWGPILWTRGAQPPSLDDFVGHIEYMVNLVGVDHVGVASDSTTSMRIDHILQHAAEVNVAYPAVTEDFVSKFGNGLDRRYPVSVAALPSVTARLLERGWKRDDVAKVMGGNFLRVWRAVWG